ncbi:MAG: tyrosine-type recombinase/integrase [Ramlibacter sp.]|nr:tyrosine-type recombinase/integrase [Ramlibacter sp.]
MPTVGRRRKDSANGLEPRVYPKHGAFYYVHRGGRWEHLGTDQDTANRKARVFNDPDGLYGTVVYWLDRFVIDCEARVKAGTLAQRTLDDYRDAIEISHKKDGTPAATGALRTFFAPPMTPLDITPNHVQLFLATGAKLGRAYRANREKACLSAFMSWLIVSGEVPGLIHNPCMRSAGVVRNPERKRERYVTHDEFREVWAVATRAERLLMELTYRTLQRPESDIILWTTASLVTEAGRRKLDFVQNKTGRQHKIALSPALDELITPPVGNVRKLRDPLVRRLDGGFYTYSGISSMLKRSIDVANERRRARGIEPMPPFGFRDLKGKGATDMYYIAKRPIEDIQQLLGHANKTTTEIYIKQRWRETAEPNMVVMG